jgi:phosphatidate cytidylyltransferase
LLRWRLLLGVLFIASIVALCWLDHRLATPGLVLLPLAMVLSALASAEMLWLLSARGFAPRRELVYGGNLLIVASCAMPLVWQSDWGPDPLGRLGWPLSAYGLLVLVAFCGEMRRYSGPGHVMEQLAATLFALSYVGVLLGFVCQMRWLGDGAWGVPAIATLVIVVKMCDTGAYTCGRLFGKRKMAPVLSPGKTLEGAAGGVAFACLGSWIAFTFLVPAMNASPPTARVPLAWMWYGLIVGLTGMFGDLAESLIKRDMGRKDSSNWMPGFGGVLDVLDSILFAAPVAYLCWIIGWR